MSNPTATFIADPQDDLDYEFDWSTWLAVGEAIIDFSVTATDGVTLGTGPQAASQTAGKVTYWLTGGTTDVIYKVVCHITTSAGRQKDALHRIRIRDLSVTSGTAPVIPDGGTIDGGTP